MTLEHKGKPSCRHTWVYDDVTICTNPPMGHRICSQCGRVEHIRGKMLSEGTFGDMYDKFHLS